MLALLLPLLLLLPLFSHAQDVTVPVVPSNSSSYLPSNNTADQLVLGLPITPAGANDPAIFALTPTAAGLPSRDPNTLSGIGDHLWNTNPQTSNNISIPARAIAYISCDPQNYAGGNIGLSNVVDNAVAANVSAVLFYSIDQNFCVINATLNQAQTAYGRFFTMVNVADANRVLSSISGMLAGNTGAAEIMTQAAYTNVMNAGSNANGIDNAPSTAVAMIILYSITGVITALFLVIIVTGAVRAHRHPERYGPHNVLGRPRQSRAKGLARAMLDTIPIVKFGEKQPPKSGDVELGEGGSSSAAAVREAEEHRHGSSRAQENASQPTEAQQASGTEALASAASKSNDDGNKGDPKADENVSCSICTEDFEKGQDIRVLPCDHKFHPACVDPWLLDVSGTCPLCRVDLRPKEERGSGDNANQQQGNERRGSREGEPLPPPLNESQGRNRRRDTILNFLDRRRMQDSNPEERISALRRWRQATQNRLSRHHPQDTAGEGSAHTDGDNTEHSQEQR
ncbi:MAG: hypothetical protein Q9162_003541 [Coniocarpon cinnabarinum]